MPTDIPGYVYVVKNPAWPGWVKVGCVQQTSMRREPEAALSGRISGLNVSDPFKAFEAVGSRYAACVISAERFAHSLLEVRHRRGAGEWFLCPSLAAQEIVDRACGIACLRPTDRQSQFDAAMLMERGKPVCMTDTQEVIAEDASRRNTLSPEVSETVTAARQIIELLLELTQPNEHLGAAARAVVQRLDIIGGPGGSVGR